jgi:hypothetical protein
MRECPQWFQDELTRIGGTNPYGEPIFRLVWSTEPKTVIGGKFHDGYVGYREKRFVPGTPAWALMVWEPREMMGSPAMWEFDYRDPETNLLEIGGYPKYGRYRLLQKFLHTELVEQRVERHWMDGPHVRTETVSQPKSVHYRLEPRGIILDLMLPMLMAWRRLSERAKVAALLQEELQKKNEFLKKAKDARDGTRLSRTLRSSKLVQKRAEMIEKGMRQAMEVATRYGLGMMVQGA